MEAMVAMGMPLALQAGVCVSHSAKGMNGGQPKQSKCTKQPMAANAKPVSTWVLGMHSVARIRLGRLQLASAGTKQLRPILSGKPALLRIGATGLK